MNEIRIALADDHPVVLAGIAALLQSEPDVSVIGMATSGDSALDLIRGTHPDVAVVDISLPGLNGVELARRITRSCPQVKLLTLTVHEDRAYVQPMLHGGARGYLLKRSAAEELVRAIRIIAGGGVYLDPAIAEKALAAPTYSSAVKGECCDLSPREEEVLKLTARGFSNKEVAARLNVSVKTVETYKARGTEKLSLRSRAEIVSYGACRGWLTGNRTPSGLDGATSPAGPVAKSARLETAPFMPERRSTR
ncbi:MAG: response regulator transcription factor [Hyphomicrobiaceae bacterium]|nr:response regulator transcription factor [Hyphomicrobiaceae bacterium]